MGLYSYVKKTESVSILVARFMSYVLIAVGFGFLIWAVYPVFIFEIQSRISPFMSTKSPVASADAGVHASRQVLGTTSVLSQNLRSFLQIKDWFPSRPQGPNFSSTLTQKEYWLSIPKLGIASAKVDAKNTDLSKALVHYLPSTAPGEYGSVNIFGHSTLPQLYNVKDYKTIFTYLPDLSKGDRIIVEYEGEKYDYEVYDMFVVKPEQVSVLEPQYDSSYLTLITCVPPGTYWNRLIVRAKLRHLPFQNGVVTDLK